MRSTKYDRATLEPIVKTSRSMAEVMRKLGLRPTGGNYRHINARIRNADIDASHFTSRTIATTVRSIPAETLSELVRQSTSVALVLQQLGMAPEGRAHRELSRRIRELALDTSHFRGRGWARGQTTASHPSLASAQRKLRYPDEIAFAENSPIYRGPDLVKRLLERGWRYECAWCGIAEWRGQRLVLHLDHINGIHTDNRLENLRLLCPNCHSQTSTYGNRRR